MMIHVTPAPGLHVRNPETGFQPLPPGGDDVQDSQYWRQLARMLDVAISAPGETPSVPATPPASPSDV